MMSACDIKFISITKKTTEHQVIQARVNTARYVTCVTTAKSTLFSHGGQHAATMATRYRAKKAVLFLAMFCTYF